MTIELIERFLLWSLAINSGVLLVWAGAFVLAPDWLFRLHGRWLRLSREAFDSIHYGAMAAYKLTIWLLNLVPYLALRLAAT